MERKIANERKVDSMLVEILRKYQGHLLPVGAMTIPFGVNRKTKLDEVYFNIVYYAASVRPEFTDYICVPYNLAYITEETGIQHFQPSKRQ